MKVRDSGMPEREYWESLLDVDGILDALRVDRGISNVAEVGCGYGTFTVPVAQRIAGTLFAFDIEAAMVGATRDRLACAGVSNATVEHRDVLEHGFGGATGTLDAVLLFNILHSDDPVMMLQSSTDALRLGGRLLIIHWRSDVVTPRGPSLSIRPDPPRIAQAAEAAGRLRLDQPAVVTPPWHFAMSFQRLG